MSLLGTFGRLSSQADELTAKRKEAALSMYKTAQAMRATEQNYRHNEVMNPIAERQAVASADMTESKANEYNEGASTRKQKAETDRRQAEYDAKTFDDDKNLESLTRRNATKAQESQAKISDKLFQVKNEELDKEIEENAGKAAVLGTIYDALNIPEERKNIVAANPELIGMTDEQIKSFISSDTRNSSKILSSVGNFKAKTISRNEFINEISNQYSVLPENMLKELQVMAANSNTDSDKNSVYKRGIELSNTIMKATELSNSTGINVNDILNLGVNEVNKRYERMNQIRVSNENYSSNYKNKIDSVIYDLEKLGTNPIVTDYIEQEFNRKFMESGDDPNKIYQAEQDFNNQVDRVTSFNKALRSMTVQEAAGLTAVLDNDKAFSEYFSEVMVSNGYSNARQSVEALVSENQIIQNEMATIMSFLSKEGYDNNAISKAITNRESGLTSIVHRSLAVIPGFSVINYIVKGDIDNALDRLVELKRDKDSNDATIQFTLNAPNSVKGSDTNSFQDIVKSAKKGIMSLYNDVESSFNINWSEVGSESMSAVKKMLPFQHNRYEPGRN